MKRANEMRYILFMTTGVMLLFVLVQSSLAREVWYDYYEKGLESLEKSRWQEAVQNFNQAIELEDKPARNKKTYGMHFINYYPYLKAGIAYYHMEDFQKAERFLRKSKQLGQAPEKEIEGYLKKVRVKLAARSRRETGEPQVEPVGTQSSQFQATEALKDPNIPPPARPTAETPPDQKPLQPVLVDDQAEGIVTGTESSEVSKDIKKDADLIPPRIVIAQPSGRTAVVKEDSTVIRGRAEDEVCMGDLTVMLNGKAVQDNQITLTKGENTRRVEFDCTLKGLQGGKNIAKIVARDTNGNMSEENVVIVYLTDTPEALAHLNLGKKYYREAKYELALSELQLSRSLLATSESMFDAFIYSGFIHLAFGEEAQARTYFRQAIELSPGQELDAEIYAPKIMKLFNECKGQIQPR